MRVLRSCKTRSIRLDLSLRYQCLQRRAESTATDRVAASPSQILPKQGLLRRHQSAIVWSSLSLTAGLLGGIFLGHNIAPPALPKAGSREDPILMQDLNQRIEEEFKVKVLRGKCLGVSKQLKGEEGGWVEVVHLPVLPIEAVEKNASRDESLLAHMQGAKGLGVERLFWDRREKKLVAIVWFGGALCGWPGVTHGGTLAIALAEKLALAEALADGGRSDVLTAATPQRLPGTGNHAKMLAPAAKPAEPSEFCLAYVKPTYANTFYVIRVQPTIPLDETAHGEGHEFEATLETMGARTCVKAKAKFAPSSTAQRKGDTVVDGTKGSYEEFKEWMWPSRQKTSQIT